MSKSKGKKVPRLTEEQYAEYLMALKDEKPVDGYSACAEGKHSVPHLDAEHHAER